MALSQYTGIVNSLKTISNSLPLITGNTPNITLFIPQGSGNVVVDPITGNFTVETGQSLEFKAKVIQKKDPFVDVNAGQDFIRTYLEGYLIAPLFFDGTVPSKVDAILLQNNINQQGLFTFIDSIPTALNENFNIQSAIGQKFCGYFQKPETNL